MENQILIALKNNKLLKNILFDDLDVSNIKGDLLTISEGEILFREGKDSDFLYLVVSGEINLLRKRQGSKAASLIFNDHDFLGCEEFIESSKRQATAVALRDSYIIALSKDEVDNLIDQNDEILHNIYEAINSNEINDVGDDEVIAGAKVDFTSTKPIDTPTESSFASKVFQTKNRNEEETSNKIDESLNADENILLSGYAEDEDIDFDTAKFNVASSEVTAEELNDIYTEDIKSDESVIDKEPLIDDELAEDADSIIYSESDLSKELEDELLDSLPPKEKSFESKIENETEELLDKYEDEVIIPNLESNFSDEQIDETHDVTAPIAAPFDDLTSEESVIPDNPENELDTEETAENNIPEDLNDEEALLNKSLEDVLIAKPPFFDEPETEDILPGYINEVEEQIELKSEVPDEVEQEIDNEPLETCRENEYPLSDENSTETQNELDNIIYGDEHSTQEDEDDIITSEDIIDFVPSESQFAYDNTPNENLEPVTAEVSSDLQKKPDDNVTAENNVESNNEQQLLETDDSIVGYSTPQDESAQSEVSVDDIDQIKMSEPESDAAESQDEPEISEPNNTEDVFSNYEDGQSLEPLIPSAFKVNFKQEIPADEFSNELKKKAKEDVPVEDTSTDETDDAPPKLNDDDFNFDERFGKIDPFYDAELENIAADEDDKEAVTDEQSYPEDENKIPEVESKENDFRETEQFTPPAAPEDQQLIEDTNNNAQPKNERDTEQIFLTGEIPEENKIDESGSDSVKAIINDELETTEAFDPVETDNEIMETDSPMPQNHRTVIEYEQTVNLLEKINKAAEQVNSNIQIDEVLKNIVNSAVEITHADRGTLYILDKNKKELWSKVAMGNEFKEIKLNVGEGIAGWVAKSGEVINLEKVQEDPRFNTSFDKLSGYVTKSMLCFPIKDKQAEVVGVVQLLNSKNGAFTKLDEEFLESLSIHAAMALQNAGLVEKLLTSERVSSLGKMANFLIQDIKKPIMVSKRYAEHLKSKSLDQDVTRVVDMLLDQLNHIAELVQSTSSYSEGQIVLRSVISKLNETLDDYVSRLDSFLRASNCQINKKYDNELNVKISEKQFYQAIQSIIKNACQAMPEGGNIYLTTEKVEDRVLIKIKDQGLGIPDSLHDKIFEPFMTHGKKDATGLGLSITKKIIEEHGGKISVISNVGDGATFVIDLPLVYAV